MNWTRKRPETHGLFLVCFDGLRMKAVDVFRAHEWLVIDEKPNGDLFETPLASPKWDDVLWLGPLPQPLAPDDEERAA